MSKFAGLPYPTRKTPLGYWYSQTGVDQIKSDMLTLLLTNPGERVMLPEFGTPLRRLIFEPNDETVALEARTMIIESLLRWEPRVAITNVEVSNTVDENSLNNEDDNSQTEHILFVRIIFIDPENLAEVQELTLQVPLTT